MVESVKYVIWKLKKNNNSFCGITLIMIILILFADPWGECEHDKYYFIAKSVKINHVNIKAVYARVHHIAVHFQETYLDCWRHDTLFKKHSNVVNACVSGMCQPTFTR